LATRNGEASGYLSPAAHLGVTRPFCGLNREKENKLFCLSGPQTLFARDEARYWAHVKKLSL